MDNRSVIIGVDALAVGATMGERGAEMVKERMRNLSPGSEGEACEAAHSAGRGTMEQRVEAGCHTARPELKSTTGTVRARILKSSQTLHRRT